MKNTLAPLSLLFLLSLLCLFLYLVTRQCGQKTNSYFLKRYFSGLNFSPDFGLQLNTSTSNKLCSFSHTSGYRLNKNKPYKSSCRSLWKVSCSVDNPNGMWFRQNFPLFTENVINSLECSANPNLRKIVHVNWEIKFRICQTIK